jgi:hypothetical protein
VSGRRNQFRLAGRPTVLHLFTGETDEFRYCYHDKQFEDAKRAKRMRAVRTHELISVSASRFII